MDRLLAFTRRYLDEDRWTPGRQVWLMSLTGGGTSPCRSNRLTEAGEHLYTGLTWHPDGSQLAAVRFNVTLKTDPPEIWLVGLDGKAIRLNYWRLSTNMDPVIKTGTQHPTSPSKTWTAAPHSGNTRGKITVIVFWSAECPWSARADETCRK